MVATYLENEKMIERKYDVSCYQTNEYTAQESGQQLRSDTKTIVLPVKIS